MGDREVESAHNRLLEKYFVPGMGLYTEPQGEVTALLHRLERGEATSDVDRQFALDKGLFGLANYIDNLNRTGVRDRRLLTTSQERRREATARNRLLREKYGFGFIEEAHFPNLMKLLHLLDKGKHLTDEDVVWLKTTDNFTPVLRRKYHLLEAQRYQDQFKQHRNPHDAASANSNFRKAGQPEAGLKLLGHIDFDGQHDPHLKSILYTTKGGSLRDLGRREGAIAHAEKGHLHAPNSFHPCTLLGALYYELGDRVTGDQWFAKAVERGAQPEAIDAELLTIWNRLPKSERDEMRRHLLQVDAVRYRWVNEAARKRSPGFRPGSRRRAS